MPDTTYVVESVFGNRATFSGETTSTGSVIPHHVEPPIKTKVRDITVGAADGAPGRYFRVKCTVAGDVYVKFSDGTTETISVEVGYTLFPFAVVRVVTTGTTATATYANLS